MTSIYQLKPMFQSVLRPICTRLAAANVSANQVTIAAVVLSAFGGAWIAFAPESPWPYLALPAVLLLRMALNAIDGMLAREHDMKSPLGAILNELGDVVSDALLYLPLLLAPGMPAWGVVGVVLLGTLVEMTGVVSVQIGGERRYDGPFGKSDRAFVFAFIGIIVGFGVPYASWIAGLFALLCVLSLLTIFNRARKALRQVEAAQ